MWCVIYRDFDLLHNKSHTYPHGVPPGNRCELSWLLEKIRQLWILTGTFFQVCGTTRCFAECFSGRYQTRGCLPPVLANTSPVDVRMTALSSRFGKEVQTAVWRLQRNRKKVVVANLSGQYHHVQIVQTRSWRYGTSLSGRLWSRCWTFPKMNGSWAENSGKCPDQLLRIFKNDRIMR